MVLVYSRLKPLKKCKIGKEEAIKDWERIEKSVAMCFVDTTA